MSGGPRLITTGHLCSNLCCRYRALCTLYCTVHCTVHCTLYRYPGTRDPPGYEDTFAAGAGAAPAALARGDRRPVQEKLQEFSPKTLQQKLQFYSFNSNKESRRLVNGPFKIWFSYSYIICLKLQRDSILKA